MRWLAESHCDIVTIFPGRVFAQLEAHALPIPGWHGFAVFHGTSYSVPRFARTRTIGTFYDVAYLRVPEAYPAGVAEGFDRSVRRALQHVDRIVAVSKHAKEDLMAAYGLNEPRIEVIYPAALHPNGASRRNSEKGDEAGMVPPFMLFVGEIGPRKNLVCLLRAFARAATAIPHALIIAGPDGPLPAYVANVRAEAISLGIADRVHFTGWLPDIELAKLYANSCAVLLPSLYEGFGYPLIDAMVYGKPIVTSNISSMPEVAGEAALLVNPLVVDEIAEAIVVLAREDAVCLRLVESGRRRAALFTTGAMVDSFRRLYATLVTRN
jgi:glycosyltransferase involved in cell wall biosynthesis